MMQRLSVPLAQALGLLHIFLTIMISIITPVTTKAQTMATTKVIVKDLKKAIQKDMMMVMNKGRPTVIFGVTKMRIGKWAWKHLIYDKVFCRPFSCPSYNLCPDPL